MFFRKTSFQHPIISLYLIPLTDQYLFLYVPQPRCLFNRQIRPRNRLFLGSVRVSKRTMGSTNSEKSQILPQGRSSGGRCKIHQEEDSRSVSQFFVDDPVYENPESCFGQNVCSLPFTAAEFPLNSSSNVSPYMGDKAQAQMTSTTCKAFIHNSYRYPRNDKRGINGLTITTQTRKKHHVYSRSVLKTRSNVFKAKTSGVNIRLNSRNKHALQIMSDIAVDAISENGSSHMSKVRRGKKPDGTQELSETSSAESVDMQSMHNVRCYDDKYPFPLVPDFFLSRSSVKECEKRHLITPKAVRHQTTDVVSMSVSYSKERRRSSLQCTKSS